MSIDDLLIRLALPDDAHAIAVFQTTAWNEAYESLIPEEHLDETATAQREYRWRDRLASGVREAAMALDRLIRARAFGRFAFAVTAADSLRCACQGCKGTRSGWYDQLGRARCAKEGEWHADVPLE